MKRRSPASHTTIVTRATHQRAPAALFVSLLLVTLLSAVVSATAQSQPTAGPGASPQRTPVEKRAANEDSANGSIKGRIVADDGRPIANATLIAQAVTGPPSAKPARVDSEGRFSFNDLPPAGYIVIAMAPGYIDESFTGDQSQWPRHLIGAQLKITMIKGGVITGRVTNSKGDPIVGIPVHAVALNNASSSPTDFLGTGGAESDDRGIYRIYGLRPGQYVVNAGGGGQFGVSIPSGFDLDAPTYYPSATRDTAIAVVAQSGQETTGIDIKYLGTEGHRVSGFVIGGINAASASNGAVAITLAPAGTQSLLSVAIASPVDPRRPFGFNGIADGEYDLFATFQTGQPNDASLVATKRVTVRGEDVTGLELTLAQLATIAGTITLEPIKPEDKCDQRGSQLLEILFNPRRDDPRKSNSQVMTAMLGGFGGVRNSKGEFIARNLEAGRYRFEIKLPTEAWYVRAINLPTPVDTPSATQSASASSSLQSAPRPGQAKPWQGVVTVKSGQQISGVSIMIGQNAAGLRGRVAVTPEGAAVPADLHVHFVPADPELANDVLRYSESVVMSDGGFAFSNIAPGRYFIVSRVEPGAETQGASRRLFALDPTTRVKLRREAEATKVVVELKPCQRLSDYALALKTEQ